MITDQQRRLIHLAKCRIDLADADYRAMLQRVAGVESSNDLEDASFSAVMAELGRLGFQTVQQARPRSMASAWAWQPRTNSITSAACGANGRARKMRPEWPASWRRNSRSVACVFWIPPPCPRSSPLSSVWPNSEKPTPAVRPSHPQPDPEIGTPFQSVERCPTAATHVNT